MADPCRCWYAGLQSDTSNSPWLLPQTVEVPIERQSPWYIDPELVFIANLTGRLPKSVRKIDVRLGFGNLGDKTGLTRSVALIPYHTGRCSEGTVWSAYLNPCWDATETMHNLRPRDLSDGALHIDYTT